MQSVIDQTFTDWEMIVVDDGSTDNSREVAEGFIKKYPDKRIKYIYKEDGPSGTPAAVNLGIKNMEGKYFAWLSSDDAFMPEKLKKQYEIFQNNPALGMIYTNYLNIDDNSQIIGKGISYDFSSREEILFELFKRNFINGNTVLIKKGVFDKLGLFLEKDKEYPLLWYAAEYLKWLEIVLNYDVNFIKEPIHKARLHDVNRSHIASGLGSIASYGILIKYFLRKYGAADICRYLNIGLDRESDIEIKIFKALKHSQNISGIVAQIERLSKEKPAVVEKILEIETISEKAKYYGKVGNYCLSKDRLKEAVKNYEIALKLTDDLEVCDRYNLASCYKKLEEYNKAAEQFSFLASNLYDKSDHLAGAYFHLGEIHLKEDKMDKAREMFKRCLDINPGHLKAKECLSEGNRTCRVAFVYMNNERNIGRGAGYVAAAMTRAGHKVDFYDTLYKNIQTVATEIASNKTDVLMISIMTMLFPQAVKLASLVRASSSIPILMGGVHPTIIGAEILREYPQIDYLCIGEGESMVVEFLEKLGTERLYEVKNLVYRKDGKIWENPCRPAEDLSTLPEFPWELFPEKSIVQEAHGFLYVHASRGCPYDCSYCCNGVYLRHYKKGYIRFRPVKQVIQELRFLKERYVPKLFYFGDEMILSKPDYALMLFMAIKQEIGSPYGCMARVEYITPERVSLLKETGCLYIGMGIECGDESFRRKHLNRKMTNEQIERAFALVKGYGIFTTSFNMIGYPFENDFELTQKTVELNEQIKPDFTQVTIFYPFPGTRLYEHCIKMDLLDEEKRCRAGEYYSESILKDVSLGQKRQQLDQYFNPNGFVFNSDGC